MFISGTHRAQFRSNTLPRHWLPAIRAAAKVQAYTPYITPCGVMKALREKGGTCKLYTQVTAGVYCAGSSSIRLLEALMAKGVEVFHVEGLHAKILLITDTFASVGSQNMTEKGLKNLEATVVYTEKPQVRIVERGIELWKMKPKKVTDRVLEMLKEAVRKYRAEHRALASKMRKVSLDIWWEWQKDEDRKKREAAVGIGGWHPVRSHRERDRSSREIVPGILKEMPGGWSLSNEGVSTGPLPTYCRWDVGGEPRWLTKSRGYACYYLDGRAWGVAGVYKGCISFVNQRPYWSIYLRHGDSVFDVTVRRWSGSTRPGCNFEIAIEEVNVDDSDTVGYGAFTLDHFRISTVDEQQFVNRPERERVCRLIDAINDNDGGVRDSLMMGFTKTRDGPSRNPGNRIDRFFGEGREITVFTRLWLINGGEVLVFSKNYHAVQALGENLAAD